MHSIFPTELKQDLLESTPEKEAAEFAPFMEEPPCDEEKNEQEKDNELMDGPLFSPLVPPSPTIIATKLLPTVEKDLRPFIEPLPEIIQTTLAKGVIQTKFSITLPSLEEVEVVVDHYDTAPKALHISFYGTDATTSLLQEKQALLLKTLQSLFPTLSFAISPPFYKTPSFSLPKTKQLRYSPVKKTKQDL